MVQNRVKRRPIRLTLAAGVLLPVLAAAACSSSGKSSGGAASSDTTGASSSAPTSAGSPTGPLSGSIIQQLAQLHKGTSVPPPTTGPKAQKGKSIWIISCGQSATTCSTPVDAAVAAAKAIGWKVTLFDGALDPTKYSQGITQAIAAGANAILVNSIDCDLAVGPFTQAKAAGIKIIGTNSIDCDSPAHKTGPGVFSTFVKYHGYATEEDELEGWGAARVPWIAQQTHGKAKVISTDVPGFLIPELTDKGFKAALPKLCPGCQIAYDLNTAVGDISSGAAVGQATTALQQHPQANSIMAFSSSAFPQYLGQALNASGRKNLAIMGGECLPNAIANIKSGGPIQACVDLNTAWGGWAGIDELNRQFAHPGSAPVDEGLGFQLVDRTHNLPAGDDYQPPINYKAVYEKTWGVTPTS